MRTTFLKLTTLVGIIFTSTLAFAQNNLTGTLSKSEYYDLQHQVFHFGMKNNDPDLAKTALVNMLVLNPSNQSLKDSLAILYFETGRYGNCLLVSQDILRNNKDNKMIMELKALSEQNLGMHKEAIADFQALYQKDNNVYYIYQIASLQYQVKNYPDALLSIQKVLSSTTGTQGINIYYDEDQFQENVPLKAAAYNLKGITERDSGKKDAAKTSFNEALKLFPAFELAKQNLANLNNTK